MVKIPRGHVRCEECGATLKLDRKHVNHYGWPKCCGVYMKPGKKPAHRYEVVLRPVEVRKGEARLRWMVTQIRGGFGGICYGTLFPHPGDDATEAAILNNHLLNSLVVPVYVERNTSRD